MSAKSTPKTLILAISAALLLPAGGATLSGCGDDGPSADDNNKKKKAKKRRNRGRGGGRSRGQEEGDRLSTYEKIPSEYRRDFTEADFRQDVTGEENRNPFRSYVIRQPGAGLEDEGGIDVEPTDVCNAENSRAGNYTLRDLRLIGIVLRGTRAWAQFRDSSGVGHIVKRGECLGKERAVVEQIGAGYVRLEVTPEAPPGGAAPEPRKHDVPLYPEELGLEETDEAQAAGAD